MTYGLFENYRIARKMNLLPFVKAEGCVLNPNVQKDKVLTFRNDILPKGLFYYGLLAEQYAVFPVAEKLAV